MAHALAHTLDARPAPHIRVARHVLQTASQDVVLPGAQTQPCWHNAGVGEIPLGQPNPEGQGRGTVPARQYVPKPQLAEPHTALAEVEPGGIAYPAFKLVPDAHEAGVLSAPAPVQ